MNHEISLQDAVTMTSRYRENKESILNSGQPADTLAICETFSADSIKQLLDQQGCEHFRIYYGMDENLKVHAILVGANEEGQDILTSGLNEDPGVILEDGQRCPHLCPPASVLNGE